MHWAGGLTYFIRSMRDKLHVLYFTLLSLICRPSLLAASNVLGFATTGARSHQFAVLRVGQELHTRGHNFTLLLSSREGLDGRGLGSRSFAGVNVVHFAGPKGIGTTEWFRNQPRDVTQVRSTDHAYLPLSSRGVRPITFDLWTFEIPVKLG